MPSVCVPKLLAKCPTLHPTITVAAMVAVTVAVALVTKLCKAISSLDDPRMINQDPAQQNRNVASEKKILIDIHLIFVLLNTNN
mmetsp:Transcript_5443/g.21287  ORF Transcript_5443/g.21287 Transcript_5443/m.21287 type:complete len:84 (-) Transcript_5443:1437-1688(-)